MRRDICSGLVNFIGKLGPVSFLQVEASSERAMRGSDWRSEGDCDRTVLCTWDGASIPLWHIEAILVLTNATSGLYPLFIDHCQKLV